MPPDRAATRGRAADGSRTLESAGASARCRPATRRSIPYSYQNGSVWPHDNSLIALGFKRYGFAREAGADRARHQRAASHFLLNQLPELYSGVQRSDRQFPGAVPRRQRAAGLGRRLGVRAAAGDPRHLSRTRRAARCYVDPALPAWLPDITLFDLRLGRRTFDIRFWRDGPDTKFEVTRGDSRSVVHRSVTEMPDLDDLLAQAAN